MRIAAFVAELVVIGVFANAAVAQAPASDAAPPTREALERAIATLPPGRIARPESYDSMRDEQQRYLASVLAGPRSAVSGPLVVMLASPTLGDLAQRTMAYARFAGTENFSSVPVKLNELAILMAARTWVSPYVWEAHDRYAVRVGLPPALVDAIRTGSAPPRDLEPDVQAVYEFLESSLEPSRCRREVRSRTHGARRRPRARGPRRHSRDLSNVGDAHGRRSHRARGRRAADAPRARLANLRKPLRVGLLQQQLLHAPVRRLADVELALRRAGECMRAGEFPEVSPCAAEDTEHRAVECHLEYASRVR